MMGVPENNKQAIAALQEDVAKLREELRAAILSERKFILKNHKSCLLRSSDLEEKINERLDTMNKNLERGDEKAADNAFQRVSVWLKALGVV